MITKECGVSRPEALCKWGGGTPTTRFPAAKSAPSWPSRKRVAARFRRFGERIQVIRGMAEDIAHQGGEYAYQPARVSPLLKVWGVPEGLGGQRSPVGFSPLSISQGPMPTDESADMAAQQTPFGRERKRKGLGGMTQARKRDIDENLTLWEEFKKLLCLWTVNLTDEDYVDLARLGTWNVFQRRSVDRLQQHLRLHGDVCLVLAVVEHGPKRSGRLGRPIPHLHIVTSGWGSKINGKRYLLDHELLDELVNKACDDAGLPRRDRKAASNVERVRHSPRSYLKGYLKKAVPVEDLDLSDGWETLVPYHWGNTSKEAKLLLAGHTVQLPPAFVAFVIQERKALEAMQLGSHRVVIVGHSMYLGAPRPIEIECMRFWTPEHLARAIELFLVWSFSPEAFAEEAALCPDLGEPASHNPDIALPPLPSLI